jgi:hypothetical protein
VVKVHYLGAKPYGVERVEIAWSVSETAINSPDQLANNSIFPQNPWEWTFSTESVGKRCTIRCAILPGKGQVTGWMCGKWGLRQRTLCGIRIASRYSSACRYKANRAAWMDLQKIFHIYDINPKDRGLVIGDLVYYFFQKRENENSYCRIGKIFLIRISNNHVNNHHQRWWL